MAHETLSQHIDLVLRTLKLIEELQNYDLEDDATEAPWYELWDLILNWLRTVTNFGITVHPQPRFARPALADPEGNIIHDDWSTAANTSGEETSHNALEHEVLRRAQIPDFTLNYKAMTANLRKQILSIIEIKPPKASGGKHRTSTDALRKVMRKTLAQTLLQARHAFECYSNAGVLYVFIVVGYHWHMFAVHRRHLLYLPTAPEVYPPMGPELAEEFRADIVPKTIFNPTQNGYSAEFKDAWKKVTDRFKIDVSQPLSL